MRDLAPIGPAESWARFIEVAAKLKEGDKEAAAEYLRGIEAKAGRQVALEAKKELLAWVKHH